MTQEQKKQKVLQLLEKQKETALIKLSDNMTPKDIDDLYFLLTTTDKKTIEKFVKEKELEIKKEFNELKKIESQSERLCLQFEIDKNK